MSPEKQTLILARTAIRSLCSHLANALKNQRLLLSIVGGALLGYLVIGHFLFVNGLGHVAALPGVGSLLTERILFLVYFLFFLMLVFSNGIISYIALFRSQETKWLLTLPIDHRALFAWRTLEGIIFSSWGLVILSAPLLSAYGNLNGMGALFYLKSIALVVVFITVPACIASAILLLFVRFTPTKAWWGIAVSAGIGALMGLLWLYRTGKEVVNAGPASAALAFGDAMRHTDISMNPWLPSAWVSEAIYGWADLGMARPNFSALILISTAMMTMLVTFRVFGRLLYPAHTASIARNAARRTNQKRDADALGRAFTGRGSHRSTRMRAGIALARKDGITFRRDAAQWLQFLIIFGLLSIYVLNIRNLGYDYEEAKWMTIIVYLNFTVCSLALSTLTTRFVFPQFSLEGQRLWILGMAPVSLPSLLMQKFLQSALATGAITVPLIVLSGVILKLAVPQILYLSGGMAAMTLGLNAIALGLGTLLPDLKQTNSAKIVSGFGGTLCLVASFLYIVTIALTLLLPELRAIINLRPSTNIPTISRPIAMLIAFSIALLTSGTLMGLACQRIKRLNFLRNL